MDPDRCMGNVSKWPGESTHAASNLEYIERGIEKISESDYDIVFSNYVLHWIKDKDLTLKQVAHCLKKGGRLGFLVVPSFPMIEYLSANSQNKELIQRVNERLFLPPEEKFKQKLISNGFDINHWEIGSRSWILDGLDGFINFYDPYFGSIDTDCFKTVKCDDS